VHHTLSCECLRVPIGMVADVGKAA